MELFKGQSLLEFTERLKKTDLDCEEYLASIKWKKGYCAVNVYIQNTKFIKIFDALATFVQIQKVLQVGTLFYKLKFRLLKASYLSLTN